VPQPCWNVETTMAKDRNYDGENSKLYRAFTIVVSFNISTFNHRTFDFSSLCLDFSPSWFHYFDVKPSYFRLFIIVPPTFHHYRFLPFRCFESCLAMALMSLRRQQSWIKIIFRSRFIGLQVCNIIFFKSIIFFHLPNRRLWKLVKHKHALLCVFCKLHTLFTCFEIKVMLSYLNSNYEDKCIL
jgi:hypothetical protein